MNTADRYISAYINRANTARKQIESWSQEKIDEAVMVIGRVVYDNAEDLAVMAVEETEMGRVDHKTAKNRGKAGIIWNSLRGEKSRGIISRDEKRGIVEIAKPVGIVAAVTPCTNPVVTPMCNAMFAVKGGNAIIFTPHHRAIKTSTRTVELINSELQKLGAPDNLIQILDQHSRENTRELMASADVVVATGGSGMVKAAYSSGKPAFGVGAGNVQCIIDRDIDFKEAAVKIRDGRSFDNGIICSGEQSVIVHHDDLDSVISAFRSAGCWYTDSEAEVDAFRKSVFPAGHMNPALVGKPAAAVAAHAGVEIPEGTQVILLKADGSGGADNLSKEKMCPVLSVYTYTDSNEALDIAEANLNLEGAGHSVCIHSKNREFIELSALRLPASRFVINQPSSTSAGGSFFNGFTPTTTLGCGSWGNNSISENLSFRHLINISRIGYFMKNKSVPDTEELWRQ